MAWNDVNNFLIHHLVAWLSPFLTQLRTRTSPQLVYFEVKLKKISSDSFSIVAYIQRLQLNPALWSFTSRSDLRKLWNGYNFSASSSSHKCLGLDLRLSKKEVHCAFVWDSAHYVGGVNTQDTRDLQYVYILISDWCSQGRFEVQ